MFFNFGGRAMRLYCTSSNATTADRRPAYCYTIIIAVHLRLRRTRRLPPHLLLSPWYCTVGGCSLQRLLSYYC